MTDKFLNAFKNRVVWAGATLGTIFAILIVVAFNNVSGRVTSVEDIIDRLPCADVVINDPSTITQECRDITRQRAEAVTPEIACQQFIEKAESQLVFYIGSKVKPEAPLPDENIVLVNVRCR